MNLVMRQRLVDVAKDVQIREILTLFYRDQPQGASFERVKEVLFLHDAFEESQLQQLMAQQILSFDGKRYKLTADARQVFDRDSTILMDEFLRE